jgi:hypothetical protein
MMGTKTVEPKLYLNFSLDAAVPRSHIVRRLAESPWVSWRLVGLESRRVDGRAVGIVGGLELCGRHITDRAV